MKQNSTLIALSAVLFGLLSCALVLTGCASTAERTESLLAEGRVDDALGLIENARRKDPKDSEYAGLERRVRLQWISDKLIEVRLSRLANNKGASTELMRKVLKHEAEWSLIPTGAVYATQAEETGYLSEFVQSAIYELLAKKQPLAAMARYQADRPLLEDVLKIQTVKLKQAIAEVGRQFCEAETKNLSRVDYYRARFLNEACRQLQHTIRLPKTENSVRLFGELTPDLQLTRVPPERISDFSQNLKSEFEKSIWYEVGSKKTLALNLSGDLAEKISERTAYRSKPYTVRVPYEETSVRTKAVRTGLQTFFEILAWALTTYQPNQERDNGDGTVTVTETKYRDESRFFSYQATEVTQELELSLTVELAPQGPAHSFEFKERLKTVSDEHGTRFEAANLTPEARRLTPPSQWLLSLNRKLMDRISAEFNVAWVERFCGQPKTAGSVRGEELHHRCLYGANGHAPSIVREWFVARYGLEIETWRQLAAVSK